MSLVFGDVFNRRAAIDIINAVKEPIVKDSDGNPWRVYFDNEDAVVSEISDMVYTATSFYEVRAFAEMIINKHKRIKLLETRYTT